MNEENTLNTSNPLHLTSLFGESIFLIREENKNSLDTNVSDDLDRILNVFIHSEGSDIPHIFRDTFYKIAQAIKWQGKSLPKDAMISKNGMEWINHETVESMIIAVEPQKIIIWHERDLPGFPNLTPYSFGEFKGIKVLKLSSPDVILATQAAKPTAWIRLTQFFEIS